MIFTFKINTTETRRIKECIETYCIKNNINFPKENIEKLANCIHEKPYMFVDEVCANCEDDAWDKVDDERVIEELEITEVDDSDEIEADERAKARWESLQEDIAMERYYEDKYGK